MSKMEIVAKDRQKTLYDFHTKLEKTESISPLIVS